VTTAEEIAADLRARIPNLKQGSLSVFGDVFGGRVDNIHTIVALMPWTIVCGSPSTVGSPYSCGTQGVTATETEFKIQFPSRVRWEWFYYGREKVLENRYYIDHARVGDKVTVATDADWAPSSFSPSTRRPAIELLGM
jgi:hypothetical protein